MVLGGVLFAVTTANETEARRHIDEALILTASAFRRSLATREQILVEKARLLSGDFAFKQAAATRDHPTLLSALDNHRARVGASVMMLLEMDGVVIADTLHAEVQGINSPLTTLLDIAANSAFGDASAIEAIDGRHYQLVVVPLFTPEPSAWIIIGFALENEFALALQRETNTHVSLLTQNENGWTTFSSTYPDPIQDELHKAIGTDLATAEGNLAIELGGDEYVSSIQQVSKGVIAVLQRSLDAALRPYMRLQRTLLVVFAVGLALSLVGGLLLASQVTRPVSLLAQGAMRVAQGEYDRPIEVSQRDELGMLGNTFNDMMHGLTERDRVRDLLGKVVSPEIAEELLRKEIELGGEERWVSVLFTDVRNFTGVAEARSPQGVVAMLNAYLTRVSGIIEDHGGVVDKYVGDAVMALFGAPIQREDDAEQAVRTALALCAAMQEITAEITARRGAPLAFGVGVHTGIVVAGNMGSPSRLNYTVIGDGVNLASRLEGLTQYYGVGAIVSEATRDACPEIVYRELDLVRVKGRKAPLAIYEPMGFKNQVDRQSVRELSRYHEGIQRFRAGAWSEAGEIFDELACAPSGSPMARLYRERIRHLQEHPPSEGWDGVVTFDQK